MTRIVAILAVALAASGSPALAAGGKFVSLQNTNFVVLISFLLFIGVLIYFKVPPMLTGHLDKRADQIRAELDEARGLREEAQTLLASYERRQAEVKEHAERIVAQARRDAEAAAEEARAHLKDTIARRIRAAEEQIEQAEASAVRSIRDRAIQVAVAAAGDLVAGNMTADAADRLIEDSIETVAAKLHS